MKKLTIIAAVLVAILLVLVSVLIGLEVRNNNELPDNTDNTGSTDHMDTTEFSTTPRPWEQPGAKQPVNYTWEEFLALSPELQIAFQGAFGSEESFEDWLSRTQPTNPEQSGYPWDQPGAKRLEDYTWEEFLALSPELQIAFQNSFSSTGALEEWLDRVQRTEPEQIVYPWAQPGGKQPEDYTWEEFLDLPPELQIAFQFAFRSADGFEKWMNQKMPKP